MKNFTKRFLNKFQEQDALDHTNENAKKAESKIFLPNKLWQSLTKKSHNSKLLDSVGFSKSSAFMAGVAVGWAECHKDVK